ncbi:MAG: FG-GAP-like repeat-containing protein, partial [bacterium]
MTRSSRRARAAVIAVALAVSTTTCRREQVSVEQLYTTRTLGQGYLQRNQLAEAETEFKKLTELAPDDPLGFASLGLTYLQAGRFAEAETQLDRARKLDPASAEIALALARLYALTNRTAEARTTLERLQRDSTGNAHVLFALAELDAMAADEASSAKYRDRLRAVLAVAPANLAVRMRFVDAFLRHADADSAVHQLEEVRRIPPELPAEARAYVDSTIQLLRVGKLAEARTSFGRLSRVVEVTAPYQASLEDVKWTDGPIPGRAVLNFAPKDFANRGVRAKATVDLARFVDGTLEAGLPQESAGASAAGETTSALAVGDVDGDGRDDIFLSTRSTARLYRVVRGSMQDVTARSRIVLPQGASFATFADVDNDGWLDLFALGGDGRAHLFHNRGDGTFDDVSAKAAIGDVKGARKALFVDLDHDGDLDLLIVGDAGRAAYRNNLDGTFTDATASFGLAGGGELRDAVFGDFDGDGRIDLFLANAKGSDELLRNGGAQRFSDATAASGLTGSAGSGAAVVGDYDNDGFLDLFVASASGGEPALWHNDGHGVFRRDGRSSGALQALRSRSVLAATFVDFDNDGFIDLIVGSAGGGKSSGAVSVFRNDGTGKFLDRTSIVPESARTAGATAIAVADVDDDGDEDLLLTDATGAPRLLRNELGNSNLAVNVELKGLRNGSGKNNAFGIGARVELRVGEIYQTRVATGRRTHFGLGSHLKADVVKVEWPNGLPQTIYFPGTDQDVVENETLKGSCAFAYTWDGKRFRFVTDAMWRSALGMPLGLMGGSSAFAPAGASQEYLRIPGDALQPRDGKYVLQLTEELWETAYADEVKLIAVDHPDSVDVFVDERFVPPGPVRLELFHVGRKIVPLSAVDERGADVLPA